jgi:ABC-type uncharacterized transport system permease subunit
MGLKLERRAQISSRANLGAPLLAVMLTLIGGLVIFSALGKDPLHAFKVFFFNPVKDLYGVSELLLKATPLMLIAMGLAVGFRANVWNIGAEGQFIAGAIAGSGVALAFDQTGGVWVIPAMMLAGIAGGAFWAAIPALLRSRFNANEILVSLMLVYVAQLLVSWVVHGPWKDPMGFNFPQTRMFEDTAVLSPLITGQAEGAARHAGFPVKRAIWIGMLAGGATAGLAGLGEVAGPMGQLTEHVSNDYGFSAIIVAFVGRLTPVGIFLASLLMALMVMGGEQAQQYLALPSSVSKVFQGMLLFFLLGTDVFARYRLRWTPANHRNA